MANQPSKYSKFLIGAASAALVASAVAPVASAADFKDTKGNTHEPAIDALSDAGVISGYPDGTFLPNKTLTRSDVVKMMGKLLVSLGKEVPTDYKTNPRFTDQTSKTNDELLKYSALVKDNGVFNGLENGSLDAAGDITRENMALVLVRAYDAINKTDLVAHVKEQEFKKDVTDLATAKAEARPYIDVLDFYDITNPVNPTFNPKDTTTRGQFASFLFKTTAVEAPGEKVTTATKVESVTATNLKEVVVAFDGTVDKTTAGDADYYSIVDGSNNDKAIKTAKVSEDLKSVTLTLDTGVEFANQEDYELSFDNVKAGDKVLSVKDYAFTPVDAALPVATSVTALGNKTVKITFSEPIEVANTSHFLIDGNAVIGSTDIVGNTVILRTYSALSNGEHKVEVKNVEDFFGLKSLTKEFTFNVVEDVTAPTISSVENATFEKVTLKFSEAIDPATVNPTSFHWLDGTTKKYANKVSALSDDTFLIEFSSDNKLVYATNLFVTGARDYSGNAIAADAKIQVTPVIDQTRPEVSSSSLNDARNEVTIKFNKALNEASAEKAENYVIKDADGKEVSKLKTAVLGSDNKTVTVSLVQALSQGKTYTLEVSSVSDNTTLKNVMMPYSKSLVVGDKTGPTAGDVNVTRNYNTATGANSIYVNFPEVMAVSGDGSIVEKAKYMYFDGAWKALPSGARINVTSDGKSAVITFPSNIGVNTVSKVRVQLVKDAAGNHMQPLTDDFDVENAENAVLQSVEATATNKVVLKFNQNILANTVSANDFTVNAGGNKLNVVSAEATDDKEITLTLADNSKLNQNATFGSNQTVTVDIKDTNVSTVTSAGKPVVDATVGGADVAVDKIKATLKGIVGGTTIAVQFNELLDEESDANAENDFIVRNQNGSIIPTSAYTVRVNEDLGGVGTDTVTISFNSAQSGVYTVELANPRYLEDAQDNKVAAFEATQVQVNTATVAPVITNTATAFIDAADVAAYTVSGTAVANSSVVITLTDSATPAKTVTKTVTAAANGTYTAELDATTLGEGNVQISVTAKDGNKPVSSAATITVVKDTAAPAAPTVSEVLAADVSVTGTAQAGSTVTVKEGATVLGTATAAADGTYTVTITAQTAGDTLAVTATDAAGNVSTATSVTVGA